MNAFIFILLGVLIGSAISDLVFDYRIYKLFPMQSRRYWPGAGLWMAWKCVAIARNSRNRLININGLAGTFSATTAHRDETRAFVSAMKKLSDVGAPTTVVKVEHKVEEVKP